MNANELADWIQVTDFYENTDDHFINDTMDEVEAMLRQQALEIQALHQILGYEGIEVGKEYLDECVADLRKAQEKMTTFTTQDREDAQRDGVTLNNISHPRTYELNPDSLETIEIELPDRRLTIDQIDNIFGICALNTTYAFTADQLHEFARAIERAHGIGE